MGLESAPYINGLIATNPTGSDPKSSADDHLRLIKAAILATWPNITGAVTLTQAEINASIGASVAAAAAAGATVFNGSTTYAQYAAVISPLTFQTYRRNSAGINTADPSVDSTNWTLISINQNAITSINGDSLAAPRNAILNGDMRISQGATVNLSASYQYGLADQWMIAIPGGAGISGTDSWGAGYGTTSGYMYGTTNGSWTNGQFMLQQRIPAKKTRKFNSKQITVSATFYHNTGANRTVRVQVAKANSADNFSAQTVLQTSSPITVTNGALTNISFTLSTLGAADASNGLALFIYDDNINTVTSKTYMVSDVQMEIGTVATPFEFRPNELQLCQEFYETSYGPGVAPGTATAAGASNTSINTAGSVSYVGLTDQFKVTKRVSPTMRYWDLAGNISKTTSYAISNLAQTQNTATMSAYTGTLNNAYSFVVASPSCFHAYQWEASARL